MTLDPKVATCMADLIRELASELDLHYEDSELHATRGTIATLTNAAELLLQSNVNVPDVYNHILRRYRQAAGRVQ